MPKMLHVTMPDGSVWSVPAEHVAKDRARWVAEHSTGTAEGPGFDRIFDKEFRYTLGNHHEITEWAQGDMNWEDVAEVAVKVKESELDFFQEGYVTGITEEGRTVGEATARLQGVIDRERALADSVTREDVAPALVEVRAKTDDGAWARLRNIAKESGVTAEEVIEKLEERRQAERDDAKEGMG